MSGEALFVFGLLLITILLFASGRLRLDVVAIMVILALMLSGLLSPKEVLARVGLRMTFSASGFDRHKIIR